ncbi:MAG: SocA family protein [Alphaproteobacteria bacterium]|jgi:hypothetical protein|nr:SocA family protein [Alphaproteobacteria bacterium]
MVAERFKSLVHYVCNRCTDPTKLGAVKLNKVLWYSDTFAYRQHGKSVSGEKNYIKRQFGPVPKSIIPALKQLEQEGAIVVRESTYFGMPKREYISLREPDSALFSRDELDIVDQVVEIICNNHTAASISDLSHDIVWEAAQIGEEIPITSVLAAGTIPIEAEDEAWADEILQRRHA